MSTPHILDSLDLSKVTLQVSADIVFDPSDVTRRKKNLMASFIFCDKSEPPGKFQTFIEVQREELVLKCVPQVEGMPHLTCFGVKVPLPDERDALKLFSGMINDAVAMLLEKMQKPN